MNQLTKLVALVILMAFTSHIYAQNLILKGGLNLSTMTVKDDEENYSKEFNSKLGYHLGAALELPFADAFAMEIGLLVNTAGYGQEITFFGETIKSKLNTLYLTIPILAKPKYSLNETTNIFILAGPSVGFGISGKSVVKVGDERETEDVEWGGDEGLKRLDFGLNIGAGVELGSLEVGIGYVLGLANIIPSDDFNSVAKNRNLMLTLGWKLGSK